MPVEHYENFPVASLLLPKHLRRPIEAIYRFARGADDIADEGNLNNEERLRGLTEYSRQLDCIEQNKAPESPAFRELGQIIHEWKLPVQLFKDLLDAFSQDVIKKRYQDFPELLDYCRRSANPVGRLLLHLVNRTNAQHLYQSDCICTALQLINFWQDIAIDWEKDRIYLPLEDLAEFGVTQEQIESQKWDENFTLLLDFQVNRTRQLMMEGAPLVHQLPGRMGWEIRATIQGGLRILEKIQKLNGDIFRQRPLLRPTDWFFVGIRSLCM